MSPSAARLAIPLTVAAALCSSLEAQQATFSRPFQSVSAVRELGDGRAVVLDVAAREVSLVDIAAGTAAPIGGSSASGAEYVFPVALVPLPGDTTLIVDPAGQRLVPVLADGRTIAPIAMPDPLSHAQWRGADGRGRLYFQLRPGGPPTSPQAGQPDSLLVVRWDRASNAIDTLGRVKAPATMQVSDGSMQMVRPRPFATVDDWAVAPDGSIGYARSADYHVEWLRDGIVTKGMPLAYEPIAVSAADVEAVNRADANPRGRIVTGPGGVVMTRELPPPPPTSPSDFPEVKPPFVGASAQVAPDKSLWVRRSVAANAPSVYDQFDSNGAHLRQVTLAPESRIVGMGTRGFYVARPGEAGKTQLEKHALP